MLRQKKVGQTSLEYVMLAVILLGAFLAIQNYMKRGFQGRWKEAVDGLGDQYDPRTMDTTIRHTLASSTNTSIIALNTEGGYWTKRTDVSASSERKTGYSVTGGY